MQNMSYYRGVWLAHEPQSLMMNDRCKCVVGLSVRPFSMRANASVRRSSLVASGLVDAPTSLPCWVRIVRSTGRVREPRIIVPIFPISLQWAGRLGFSSASGFVRGANPQRLSTFVCPGIIRANFADAQVRLTSLYLVG